MKKENRLLALGLNLAIIGCISSILIVYTIPKFTAIWVLLGVGIILAGLSLVLASVFLSTQGEVRRIDWIKEIYYEVVDADTNKVIEEIKEGDKISFAELESWYNSGHKSIRIEKVEKEKIKTNE